MNESSHVQNSSFKQSRAQRNIAESRNSITINSQPHDEIMHGGGAFTHALDDRDIAESQRLTGARADGSN